VSKVRVKKQKFPQHEQLLLRIFARTNNTIVSVCTYDPITANSMVNPNRNTKVLTHLTCGSMGFNNCKKHTPFATRSVINTILERCKKNYGAKKIIVMIRGYGIAREIVQTCLLDQDMEVVEIHDLNNLPYGGCRPSSRRRV